jgi:[ribosomal protein S5]-alanine N-acetyltransferase
MRLFTLTPRLILRELLPSDDKGMFELDSDPEVMRYIGVKPFDTIEQSREVIEMVRQQYIDNGIGRWAVIEKSTNDFIGWAGLKLVTKETNGHTNFYDLGYRLIRRHWGKGFATEAARASLAYGFDTMKLHTICATADMENTASRNVLEKVGMKYINTFDDEGFAVGWYEIMRKSN